MDRVILHSDLNNFYASVECLHRPEIRNKPVAVCGDAELRHGIVLAKNYLAKECGIKTGDAIWEARAKCGNLVVISADFKQYLRFSKLARDIYADYTDKIESFGIDECWLDVTDSQQLHGTGEEIANKIRERIRFEMGCTASIGVSWNKIYAKLGSDMKKPDATTVISRENVQNVVYPLPVEELLYVGRQTKPKLNRIGIYTIGDLARHDVSDLKARLNKWGEYLWLFANGHDLSNVIDSDSPIKSIGNSTTAIRDLKTDEDVLMLVTIMAESVAARLREQWLKGQVVSLYIRDSNLISWGKQKKIEEPTFLAEKIIDEAMKLFRGYYNFSTPIRSVGVKVSDLASADSPQQLNIFHSEEERERQERLECTVDAIRERFGHHSISRLVTFKDKELTYLNPKNDNTIHPYAYFK